MKSLIIKLTSHNVNKALIIIIIIEIINVFITIAIIIAIVIVIVIKIIIIKIIKTIEVIKIEISLISLIEKSAILTLFTITLSKANRLLNLILIKIIISATII